MAFQVLLFLFVCFLLLGWALWRQLDWATLPFSLSRRRAKPGRATRLLKPRTPLDCPACRRIGEPSSVMGLPPPPVRPWRELKSRRGAPKR